MASPTTPYHGKVGALYRYRINGFKGTGLNDCYFGTGFNDTASAHYEVVIETAGAPDTFKWRKNGGAWTTGVAITGGTQTLSTGQTLVFTNTTGHTVDDQWSIGNLKDEACTESGTTAQITSSTRRILNPISPPTFTDSGGAQCLWIDFSSGTAHFAANVVNVTVTGNNGYVLESGLQKEGYITDWTMNLNLDMADITSLGDNWKTGLPGMGGGTVNASSFFCGTRAFFRSLDNAAQNLNKYLLLQLFNYDPDQDQTGDHFNVWGIITSAPVNAPVGDVVKEQISFQLHGKPYFVANT